MCIMDSRYTGGGVRQRFGDAAAIGFHVVGINVIGDRASGVTANGRGLKSMGENDAIADGRFECLTIDDGGKRIKPVGHRLGKQQDIGV